MNGPRECASVTLTRSVRYGRVSFAGTLASHTGSANDSAPARFGVNVSRMRDSSPGLSCPLVGLTYSAGVTGSEASEASGESGGQPTSSSAMPSALAPGPFRNASSSTQHRPCGEEEKETSEHWVGLLAL